MRSFRSAIARRVATRRAGGTAGVGVSWLWGFLERLDMVATGRKWAMMHGNMDFEFQKENVAIL